MGFLHRIEESDVVIDSNPHINSVSLADLCYVLHIGEVVVGREGKHGRDRNNIFQCLNDLQDFIIAILTAHVLVSFLCAIQRQVEPLGGIFLDGLNEVTGFEAVGEQIEVGVMDRKPLHDLQSLWMQQELTALQPNGRTGRNGLALHDLDDLFQAQIFDRAFGPNQTVLAPRIAGVGGIDHQG